jgi:hypothetical protein
MTRVALKSLDDPVEAVGIPIHEPSQRNWTEVPAVKPVPTTETVDPAATVPLTESVGVAAPAETHGTIRSGRRSAGRSMAARLATRRCLPFEEVGGVESRRSSTHRVPSQNIDGSPFGSPAGFESPAALRPRLAAGVLVRGLAGRY